jgi:leucyl-tRNA synthetase
MAYDFETIEKRWQKYWKENPYFKTRGDKSVKKFYCLDMFPYPSGSGLHVGHWKGYVFSDVYARIKLLQGYNILHPMGWDAFGLPAENDAIKKGIHPKQSTDKNIENFKRQLEKIGAVYDWSKELNTTDPNYYKWTQWIFLKMYEAGLAYQANAPINWCPHCKTGLANEEVVAGCCERCGAEVKEKHIRQWILKITKYAEKLLEGLDRVDWPEKVKLMQKNWIGKSEGANICFKTEKGIELHVFTTRPDTLFGTTFMVMAPDHNLVEKIITDDQKEQVKKYQEACEKLSEIERTDITKEKTGIFTGCYAINPVNNEKIPIYLASYVLKHYGTGIVMAVPGHDQRDFEFAKKFNLKIQQVIKPLMLEKNYFDENNNLMCAIAEDGILINSGVFDGLEAMSQGFEKIVDWLESKSLAKRETCYKLRDWIFSRQRYWGEPIPLIHCEACGIVPVPEKDLPVTLPEVEKYEPTGTGESPLADIEDWVNVTCPKCGIDAKRETNTMPQWAGSCWYFLRYPNVDLQDKPFDEQEMRYWLPVDFYVGGIEHAILHLLYARFYVKVLHDLGYVPFDEPFQQLFNQGMVCMKSKKTGRVEKMSKSKGNVVNPDDIIQTFGSDTLRMYMLFMGPPELDTEWQDDSIKGVFNFLKRLWTFLNDKNNIVVSVDTKSEKRFHLFLKCFQERLENYKVNTAVSSIMEYLNDLTSQKLKLDFVLLEKFLTALSVMVPHFSSELLQACLNKNLEDCAWPMFDAALAQVSEIEIAIQVNGKLRGKLQTEKGIDQDRAVEQAKVLISKWLEGKKIIKVIFVKDRLVSFVVKG